MINNLIISIFLTALIPLIFFRKRALITQFFIFFILSLIILVSYVLYKLNIFDKPVPIENYKNCTYFKNTVGPEDFAKVSNDTFVFSSNDNVQQWEIGGPNKTANGHIFILRTENNLVQQLELIDFPIEVPFHPHGIYYRQSDNILFVINHPYMYSNPGDRIEMFLLDMKQNALIFKQGVHFGPQYNGILNDLIVYDNGKLLVTHYLSSTDPKEGRTAKSKYLQIFSTLELLFELENTYVLQCSFEENSVQKEIEPNCTVLTHTKGAMNNGITWNEKKNIVYVSDIGLSKINVFQLQKKDDKLIKLNEIPTIVRVDNIIYDNDKQEILGAGPFRFIDYVNFIENSKKFKKTEEYWCGVLQIDMNKNNEQKIIFSHKTQPLGCSVALTFKNQLYIGSFADKAVVGCHQN